MKNIWSHKTPSLVILCGKCILYRWLGLVSLWCLTPLSTIFQLYSGVLFYWWLGWPPTFHHNISVSPKYYHIITVEVLGLTIIFPPLFQIGKIKQKIRCVDIFVTLFKLSFYKCMRDRRGCGRVVVGFTTTCVISAYHHWSCEFEPIHDEVCSIQHYVIKFVSDLRQVDVFLPGTPVSSINKTDHQDITEIFWKWC